MKNASLVLSSFLLIAVAVLFYLHFSSRRPSSNITATDKNREIINKDFRIAYFEMDSVQNSFAMVKDVTSDLSKKEQELTNNLNKLEKALYDKANEYQGKAKTMSQTESEMATNDMTQRKKVFDNQKEKAQQEYQNYSFRKTNEIKQTIQDFLKEYNKGKGFSYIISNEPGFIYYRDTIYNITADLIKGLNEQYATKKK